MVRVKHWTETVAWHTCNGSYVAVSAMGRNGKEGERGGTCYGAGASGFGVGFFGTACIAIRPFMYMDELPLVTASSCQVSGVTSVTASLLWKCCMAGSAVCLLRCAALPRLCSSTRAACTVRASGGGWVVPGGTGGDMRGLTGWPAFPRGFRWRCVYGCPYLV